MAKQFVWSPNHDQTYDSSYGSQTVVCSDFGRTDTTFSANCPGMRVKFQVLTDSSATDTYWSMTDMPGSVVSVLSGDVVFDFGGVSSLRADGFEYRGDIVVTGGGRLVLRNARTAVFARAAARVSGAGKLLITSVGMVDFSPGLNNNGKDLLINDGELLVEEVDSCRLFDTVAADGYLIMAANSIFLGVAFSSTNSITDLVCDEFTFAVGAEDPDFGITPGCFLYRGSKTSIVASSRVYFSGGVKFTLADDAHLSIAGIDREVFFKSSDFVFDFDTKRSNCTATVVLEPADAFIGSAIFDNGFITMDGAPVSREESFREFTKVVSVNPSTGQQVLTIQKR
ncbi:hypothetical protein PS870_06491 [Pseudomonas fluorescens]|uniref:Uncharacterized protein n=1 Tax=Pseudomonas fluorescens TaxID=294 RepID=A0A5E7QJM1_PSEFL|nr:hypothetical protein [Pseudomonas fluorescens]VVP61974.1 hypothetical protein PS870_06491 [Pseudomonas fluorescens]